MATLNAPTPKDPKELRPLLHAEVDRLTDDDLELAHAALVEIEVRRLTDELGKATEAAWSRGDITEEKVAEAVKEYRHAHPSRR